MADDVAHPARLTLPRWDGEVRPLPPARTWLLVAAGCRNADGDCALPAWEPAAGPAREVEPADLGGILDRELLGVRLAVCGTETRVAALVAAALAAGLVQDEIVLHSHGVDQVRLFCPACGTTSATGVCDGCGCTLVQHHHFARRRGAYVSTPTAPTRPARAAD